MNNIILSLFPNLANYWNKFVKNCWATLEMFLISGIISFFLGLIFGVMLTIFKKAQQVFNKWSKLPANERKTSDLLDQLDVDFTLLLDSVTIARSRKHIQKYYDTSDIGTFPTRLPAVSVNCKLTERNDVCPF